MLSLPSAPLPSACTSCNSLDCASGSGSGSTHTGDSRNARRHAVRERSRPARDSEFEVPKRSFPVRVSKVG